MKIYKKILRNNNNNLIIPLFCSLSIILSACSSQPTPPATNKTQRIVVKHNSPKYHIVRQGETLSQIANRYGLDYRRIASLNGLSNSDKIYTGQRLLLTTAPANTTTTTTITTQQRPQTTITQSNFPINQSSSWLRPITGNLIRPFNQASGIMGNWYTANQGTYITATQAGTVIYAGNSLPEYGNLIMLQHPNDYISVYAHLGSFLVKERQIVQAGQKIGTVGFIQRLNQPAFEFQIRYRGSPTNPNQFIK